MAQGLSKVDVQAMASSGVAADHMWQWLRNLHADTVLMLAGDASIAHKVGTPRVGVADATAAMAEITALANDIKEKYGVHIASTDIEGAHNAADVTNTVSTADATDHPTAVTLLTELQADLEAHDTQSGVHLNNVAITVTSVLDAGVFYDLLNELQTDYNAHRILTGGSVHGAADTVNVSGAAAATTLATAILLANDLRTQYEAHRILIGGSEHGAADATNVITAPVATDLASGLILANDLRAMYEAHRILTGGSVHGGADATNTVTEAATAELADMAANANEIKADFHTHNLLTMAASPVTVMT